MGAWVVRGAAGCWGMDGHGGGSAGTTTADVSVPCGGRHAVPPRPNLSVYKCRHKYAQPILVRRLPRAPVRRLHTSSRPHSLTHLIISACLFTYGLSLWLAGCQPCPLASYRTMSSIRCLFPPRHHLRGCLFTLLALHQSVHPLLKEVPSQALFSVLLCLVSIGEGGRASWSPSSPRLRRTSSTHNKAARQSVRSTLYKGALASERKFGRQGRFGWKGRRPSY